MARFIKPVSVTVTTDGTITIRKPVVAGQTYEVFASDAKIWVNVNGGTASKAGANCIAIPENASVNIKITEDNSTTPPQLTGIRDDDTNGIATVSELPYESN